MMADRFKDVRDLVEALAAQGIRLRTNGVQVGIRGPAKLITEDVRAVVRANKPALIQYLTSLDSTGATRKRQNRLIGCGFPPKPTPHVPDQIKADPILICTNCGQERVLRCVPGSVDGICFNCWMSGRN